MTDKKLFSALIECGEKLSRIYGFASDLQQEIIKDDAFYWYGFIDKKIGGADLSIFNNPKTGKIKFELGLPNRSVKSHDLVKFVEVTLDHDGNIERVQSSDRFEKVTKVVLSNLTESIKEAMK